MHPAFARSRRLAYPSTLRLRDPANPGHLGPSQLLVLNLMDKMRKSDCLFFLISGALSDENVRREGSAWVVGLSCYMIPVEKRGRGEADKR